MNHSRSKTPLIFFAAVVILSIVTIFLLIGKYRTDTPALTGKNTPAMPLGGDQMTLTPNGEHVDDVDTRLGGTPEDLVGRISEVAIRANDTGDVQPLIELLGTKNLSALQAKKLRALATASKLKLDLNSPFSPIQGANDRWSLNLFDRSRILLDLEKTEEGKWRVGKITLFETSKSITDNDTTSGGKDGSANPDDAHTATIAVSRFMNAIMKLDPAEARKHIDTSQITYAKLAGLCIIFEEGDYTLSKNRPLRKMFLRETSAGWLVMLETPNKKNLAMFAINTKRKNLDTPWKITEINLDKLLTDYANRFSDGDIYYTPLIKNLKGGDSLVVYFDLDSGLLTERTQHQLSIVAVLLKSDKNKKLTISGHTDALGSDQYNLTLSKKRANTVMEFFIKKGIPAAQIKISGFGKAQPRLPNQTKDGIDNPDGRRVNRRAEILLDF